MAKKLVVLQTFEQGMERREGGVIKLFEGQQLPVEQTEHGLVVPVAGKSRLVPPALVEKWTAAGLVRVDDAE